VALKEASVLTNDGRAVLSFDPNNPSIAPTVTVDGSTYTQGVDGLFAGSDGSIWSGETPGSGMTASAGSQLRSQMGDIINKNDVSDATIEEWGANVNGANTKLNDGGDTEGGKDEGDSLVSENTPSNKSRSSRKNYSKDLRYPLAKLSDDADFMRITMLEYKAGQFEEGGQASQRKMTTLGSVILPIPPTLADSNAVGWNQHEMNTLQMAGGQAAMGVMNANNFFEGVSGGVNEVLTKAANESGGLKQAAQMALVGQIPGMNASTNQMLARDQGKILNPNMELLFNGPQLRSFTYTFRLTARSEPETRIIRKIIRFFKQGMAVKKSPGTALFLESPNVFDASFHSGYNNNHPFLYKMKRSALTTFNVNYVPDGTYMTLPNKSMTAYEISLTLQELDPIYDDDYENDNDESVGF